jgi:apolipoprotein D and lipocalin family protein
MFRFVNLYILILIFFAFFPACASVPSRQEPPLEVVSQVDVNKYLGRWYEISRYPNWFQKDCYAVTADYAIADDGYSINVINRCKDRKLNGEIREAVGIAHIEDSNTNAKLNVTFFWPFYGNYWIIDLDDDYEYAVVSEPKRQYLWILSRKPKMDAMKYSHLIESLAKKNFDISLLKVTPQN